MTIKLYNTATRMKEDFIPLEEGKAGLYVCGVTVYDLCHIGHARSSIVFDVLSRYLQARGFDAVLTQTPTNRRAEMDGIGRIQVDDDDHNIFLTKISKTYLFFKDKPSWKYIRRYAIDKLAHRISETLNRVKGDNR